MTKPARLGTSNSRVDERVSPDPRRESRDHSMARRKQTTARPERMPMKTDRMRNSRSSRKTDRRNAPRSTPGIGAAGSAAGMPSGRIPTSGPFVQFGDKQERRIRALARPARRVRFALDVEYQPHRLRY